MSAAARMCALCAEGLPRWRRDRTGCFRRASCVFPCAALQPAWLRLCSFGLTEMFEFDPVLFTLVFWN